MSIYQKSYVLVIPSSDLDKAGLGQYDEVMDFFELTRGFDFLHLAFGLNFLSLFMKDILQLRFLALGSQTTFLLVGISRANMTIVLWQTLFIAINLVRTIMVLWERREIRFSPEVEAIFQTHFPTFSRHEFQLLWFSGREKSFSPGESIITQGKVPECLWFLYSGGAEVFRDGQKIARMESGHFVGEMSLLTGQPASADVRVTDAVVVREWSRETLLKFQATRPLLWIKIQGRLGRDLVTKLWNQNTLKKQGAV